MFMSVNCSTSRHKDDSRCLCVFGWGGGGASRRRMFNDVPLEHGKAGHPLEEGERREELK